MRIKHMLSGDIHIQWKYGFYLIYAVLCVIYIAILNSLPAGMKQQMTAILIYSDPAAMGLFFMGAVILLEKSQRVLNAIAVTPAKHSEYIIAKIVSFAIISLIVAAAIGLATGIGDFPLVLLGTLFSSVIFSLLGMIAATKIESLNQFMVISVGIEIVCFVPPVFTVIRPDRNLSWFPLNAAMRLICGSRTDILPDIVINLLLICILYLICRKQVQNMFKCIGGIKL